MTDVTEAMGKRVRATSPLYPVVRCGDCKGQGGQWLEEGDPVRCDTCFGTGRLVSTAALTAALPPDDGGKSEVEVTWEVWEDDLLVATSTSEADANHYLAVYSQDAEVRLVRAETRRLPAHLGEVK